MTALVWKKTTDADLKVGMEVLVKSVNGTIDLGHDLPYKKAPITAIRGRGIKRYEIGRGEYLASEITLISK